KKKGPADDDWARDTSKESVQKRMHEMVPTNLQGIIQTDTSSLPNPVVRLQNFIEANAGKGQDVITKEIELIQQTYKLDDEKLILLVSDALLPDFTTLISRIRVHTDLLNYVSSFLYC